MMKVKELIEKLSEYEGDLPVYITTDNNDGCDTCGYGATEAENDVTQIYNMETKVIIEIG